LEFGAIPHSPFLLLEIRASGFLDTELKAAARCASRRSKTNKRLIMKRFLYLTAAVAIFAATFCWICLPHANAQPAAKESAAQPTAADQQDVQRLVRAQEDRTRRVETLLVRQEQLMDKQEAAFVRFQKILDTWEQQQKQYQQYLDSLKK
jgi:septal ring factor EnvC (AmiA/AmiB activator)